MRYQRNLTLALELRGMTQSELARRIGVTRAAVNSWTKGRADPSIRHLIKAAHELDISVSELIGEKAA